MRAAVKGPVMAEQHPSGHQAAAETFTRRVRDRFGDSIDSVLLYGSVARGEERGVRSDVDLIVVLSDAVDEEVIETDVRDLAYEIELEYGVVLSLIVLTATEYERRAERPFFSHVRQHAESLYG